MAEAGEMNFVVQVTTFHNPSLFWFVYEKDIQDRDKLTYKLKRRCNHYKLCLQPAEEKEVIVHYDDEYLRATIVEIRNDKKSFICWLWDFGVFVEVNETFKIFPDVKQVPPIAKKAKLFGLRSILKHFEFSKNEFFETYTKEWSAAVRNCVLEILHNPKNIQMFKKKFVFGDSIVGILSVTNEIEGLHDVADAIVGRGYAKFEHNDGTFLTFLYTEQNSFNNFTMKDLYNTYRGIKSPEVLVIHKRSVGRGSLRSNSTTLSTSNSSSTLSSSSDAQTEQTIDCFDDTNNFSTNIRRHPSKQSSPAVNSTPLALAGEFSPNTTNNTLSSNSEMEEEHFEDAKPNAYGHVKRKKDEVLKAFPAGGNITQITVPEIKITINTIDNKNLRKDREVVVVNWHEDSSTNLPEMDLDLTRKNIMKKINNSNEEQNWNDSSEIEKSEMKRTKSKDEQNWNEDSSRKSLDVQINSPTNLPEMELNLTRKNTVKKINNSNEEQNWNDSSEIEKSEMKRTKSKDEQNWNEDSSRKSLDVQINSSTNLPEMELNLTRKNTVKKINNCNEVVINSPKDPSEIEKNKMKRTKSKNEQNWEEVVINSPKDSPEIAKRTKSKDEQNGDEDINNKNGATKPNNKDDEDKITPFSDHAKPGCAANPLMLKKCPCDICESVRDNTMMFRKYEEQKRVPKKKKIVKPNLLFNESDISPHTIRYRKTAESNLQRLLVPKILVHGKYAIYPVRDLCSVSFDPTVHQALQPLKYFEPLKTQSYSWPAIMRGQNVFIVSGPDSGKTMAYIPAICTFVLNNCPDLPDVIGPISLVICPGAKTAEKVYKVFNKLLDPRKEKIIRLAIPPFNLFQKSQILKGVDILICTPRTLIILLKEKVISFKRLLHVVLEDSNVLFNLFADDMKILLEVFQKVLVKRIYNQSIQLIIVSEQWSTGLETLAKRLYNTPLICITALLEAALYGRVDIKIQIVPLEEKPFIVIELLTDTFRTDKTIIFCDTSAEVATALDFLNVHGIVYEFINEESTADHRRHVNIRWQNAIIGQYFVLVTTDEPVNTELSITDAVTVIQYSLPNTSWSQFAFRFSCLLDNYKSPLVAQKQDVRQTKMHILIDQTNTVQFPKMIQFLERMGCNIPTNILTNNEKMTQEIESSKLTNKVELCSQLTEFGVCPSPAAVCKFRHVLSKKLDVSNFLPQSGLIKLKILYVLSPISYYCRLIEHTDSTDTRNDIRDRFGYIATQLAKLVDEKVRRPVLTARLDGIYAVEETEGVYRRCRVIKVSQTDLVKRSTRFVVHFIDLGLERDVPNCFYILPEEICDIPPQAIKVTLGNLGPLDKDSYFSENCRNAVLQEFKKADHENTNYYFIGRIMLQLANCIYVENLVLQQVLDNGTLFLNKLNIREMLFKRNVAEMRPHILDNLYRLCDDHNLDLYDYSLPVVKMAKCIPTQKEPSWAHLENLENFNKVFFASGRNPDLFYVKLCKNQILMDGLQNDIVKAMNKPLYPTGCAVVEGRCYLAKDPGGDNYERVLVKDLTDETANCFFVDFGDHAQIPIVGIKYLPDELITKLPFQVIECKLFGIKPKIMTWKNEATDLLYKIAFEPNTDLLKFLHVKVMNSESPEVTGYKKYSVILVDIFEADRIVNNLLVEQGLAKFTQNEPLEVDFEKLSNTSESDVDLCSDNENNNLQDGFNEQPHDFYIEPDMDEEDDGFEFYGDDIRTFMQELFQNSNPNKTKLPALPPVEEQAKSVRLSPNKTNDVQKPVKSRRMCSPGYSTPKVIWEQTVNTVTLKIQIIGADDYDIFIVRNKAFSFKVISESKTYKLHLNLYAKVASEVKHIATGMEIVVTMTKDEAADWPRLLSTPDKMRNITYNVGSIPIELDSDEESAVDPKKIANQKQAGALADMVDEQSGYYFVVGSDEDYDESDIDSYSDSD